MADLRDEQGNPIQLTDEFGNPVKLTDEFGNPMHLTGIATTHPPDAVVQETHVSNGTAAGLMYSGGMEAAKPNMEELARTEEGIGSGPDVDVGERQEHQRTLGTMLAEEEIREPKEAETCQPSEEIHRSSSSSSSSEDDGQGGRRKKKGWTQRIKEKLTGAGKHKEEHHSQTATAPTTTTPEHEKKSVMEKIKEKLPGGHHNH